MQERVTEALANIMTMDLDPTKNEHLMVDKLIMDGKVLGEEIDRLQTWLTAIMQRGQQGPTQILVPPRDLLRLMKRKDVYQEAAHLGYQEAGELAAEALAYQPLPEWAAQDNYVDPDDEEDEEEG